MADLLVDTDILIDLSHRNSDAIVFIQQHEQSKILGVSTITQMELFVGCRNKTEQRKTERLLRRFEVVRLDNRIADEAVNLIKQYRLSHGLLLPDALIAATAIVTNIPLASKNQKHFRYLSAVHLLPYP